jgi:pSer/pThr/pTyr-binding forkhead associated (FHA) protein
VGDEGSTGEFLNDVRELARTLTVERFEARFPWTFLAITSAESNLTLQYTTRKGNIAASATDAILDLLPMVKTATAYSGRASLLVGRSRACDLWITDASMSKTHARFTLEKGLPKTLEDLGSRNGTRVGGETLTANEPFAVRVGDVVSFGSVVARILDAPQLYALLALMRTAK